MPTNFGVHCVGCPYEHSLHLPENSRQIRAKPLSMEDNASSTLLIFQAPGVDEWVSGNPVSSANSKSAAARLARAFRTVGKARQDYNITNTVQCFPGKVPQSAQESPRDKAPPKGVRDHCAKWLEQDIELRQYGRVVVFGSHARKAVKALGYANDIRFRFLKHPTGGLSSATLLEAVR